MYLKAGGALLDKGGAVNATEFHYSQSNTTCAALPFRRVHRTWLAAPDLVNFLKSLHAHSKAVIFEALPDL